MVQVHPIAAQTTNYQPTRPWKVNAAQVHVRSAPAACSVVGSQRRQIAAPTVVDPPDVAGLRAPAVADLAFASSL